MCINIDIKCLEEIEGAEALTEEGEAVAENEPPRKDGQPKLDQPEPTQDKSLEDASREVGNIRLGN